MRPRPFGRGICSASGSGSIHRSCFNEASTFRSRNRRSRAAPPPDPRGGFNEASTFRSRNLRRRSLLHPLARASMRPRPFGRGIEAASVAEVVVGHASMRPRPFGRGIGGAQVAPGRAQLGFNEASTFRSRNRLGRQDLIAHALESASMRPRPFGRGIGVLVTERRQRLGASMRPRPFGRGIEIHTVLLVGRDTASMRPRPFGRGISTACVTRSPRGLPLQ